MREVRTGRGTSCRSGNRDGTRPDRRLAAILAVLAVACSGASDEAGTPGASASPPEVDTDDMSELLASAIADARAAVSIDPASANAWGHLGAILDAHTLYGTALECYERAARLAPDDFRYPYLSAVVMDFMGRDLGDIEEQFAIAQAIEPGFPPLHYRLGEARLRQGAVDRAVAAYRRAVELDPDFALAHRALGQALTDAGELQEALRHLERARELSPDDSVVHAALARAYHLAGDPDRSRAATERARQTRAVLSVPDPVRYTVDSLSLDPTALERRVADAMARGDLAGAQRDLETLGELFPRDPRHPLRRARCELGRGQRDAARESFARAVELGEPTGSAHAGLADLALENGDVATALTHRQAAVRARPESAPYRNDLALALAMSGDLAGSLREFETCATLAPPTAEVHHNWGTALLRQNRSEEATRHFEQALELEPSSPGTLFNLATIRERQGRRDEAIELYRRAAALDPGGPAAQRLTELR